MRQCEYVTANTPDAFVNKYNRLCRKISKIGKIVDQTPLEGFSMFVYYEMSNDEIEEKPRRCCECDNYEWGRGCPYKKGHVRVMDIACDMFNIPFEDGKEC